MAQKPKARKAAAKTGAAAKQKEQSARFIKAAQEAGVDESKFEAAIARVIKPAVTPAHHIGRKASS